MDQLHREFERKHSPAWSFARGMWIGAIAVAALALWAINVEILIAGKEKGGLWTAWRIVLCDAVPIAAIFAIHRGLGRNDSFEATLTGILHAIFFFVHPSASNEQEKRVIENP